MEILLLPYFAACVALTVYLWRRTFKAIVLPLVFLAVMAPFGAFVASGRGTHMSPLLLYPFALPWCLLAYRDGVPGSEIQSLFIGCLINAIIFGMAGAALDLVMSRRLRPGQTSR